MLMARVIFKFHPASGGRNPDRVGHHACLGKILADVEGMVSTTAFCVP
ncbi:hypothetical protein NSU_3742 [Novosphingobium pentaromativorans US6-1]|uniref:Uncharacterized protein n=1 Tax=Novosphingobium pentaromativorans US6-1 TaxID=1088721 RepID=G6EHC1_9SPHN|nr:hypothetical protein NSU_3742 [Novosphingobium pentaromativorans US6-1]